MSNETPTPHDGVFDPDPGLPDIRDRLLQLERENADAKKRYSLAECEVDNRKIDNEILQRQNAELLAALVDIRDMPEYDQDDQYRIREKARAAIAKAERRTP